MKSDQLKTLIRKIVREEVNMAVEDLKKEILSEVKQPTQQRVVAEAPVEVPTSGKYAENGTLNDLLNETALSFTSADAKHFSGTQGSPVSLSSPMGMEAHQAAPPVHPNDPMAKFLNKDYRDLMKAVDSKKNFRP